MSTPYLGEIRIVSFNFAPKGWALCNGQTLAINQNAALFSLLGTTYGGNGTTTFALPNLQARMPVHVGSGFVQGQAAGEVNVTLITSQLPAHTHTAQGVTSNASSASATGNAWAVTAQNAYAASPNTTMAPAAAASAGGSQPHPNMPPYLVLNFVIALQGIFPSRN
ncbi:MAG: tail fiber protein [Terracidiphilus sp.]